MKHSFRVLLLASVVLGGVVLAQAPTAQPPGQGKPTAPPTGTPPPTTPPTTPPKPQPRPPAAGLALSVQVTDRSGNPISDVTVRTGGPVDRSGTTGPDGSVVFRSLRAGTYRLRFEREEFTTFEREVTLRNQPVDVLVALTAAPAPPKPEPAAAPPVEPAPPPPPAPRDVQPVSLSIVDFIEKNWIGSQPMKSSLLACAEGGTAVLLQLRDPVNDRRNDDADELLYVAAGAGILRVGNRDIKLPTGQFALVPRTMTSSLRRDGRNPLIAISILAGAPCTDTTPPAK